MPEKFSLTGAEEQEISEDKLKSPEEKEIALQMAKEKLNNATNRLRGSKEIKDYVVEEKGEMEEREEQKLLVAAQNKYKAIMDHYLDKVSDLTSDEKVNIIDQIDKYLTPILSIDTKEAEDIKKKMQDLNEQMRESL